MQRTSSRRVDGGGLVTCPGCAGRGERAYAVGDTSGIGVCGHCGGTGAVPADRDDYGFCRICDGTLLAPGPYGTTIPCDYCEGTGRSQEPVCPLCNGYGLAGAATSADCYRLDVVCEPCQGTGIDAAYLAGDR